MSLQTRRFFAVLIVVAAVGVSGCSINHKRQYFDETRIHVCQGSEDKNCNQVASSFSVIEFDDYGDLWSQDQVQQSIRSLETFKDRQLLFFVFVHGWHHNAHHEDDNLISFRSAVEELGRDPQTCDLIRGGQVSDNNDFSPEPPKCAVVGIYLSWRGEPLNLRTALRHVSFWNRKAAARRAASVPATAIVFELLSKIRAHDRERWADKKAPLSQYIPWISRERSRAILIGHSFGARFLENTLAQAVIARQEDFVGSDHGKSLRHIAERITSQETLKGELLDVIDDIKREIETSGTEIITLEAEMTKVDTKEAKDAGQAQEDVARLDDKIAGHRPFQVIRSLYADLSAGGESPRSVIAREVSQLNACIKRIEEAGPEKVETNVLAARDVLREFGKNHDELFKKRIESGWAIQAFSQCGSGEAVRNPFDIPLVTFKTNVLSFEKILPWHQEQSRKICGAIDGVEFDSKNSEQIKTYLTSLRLKLLAVDRSMTGIFSDIADISRVLCGRQYSQNMYQNYIDNLSASIAKNNQHKEILESISERFEEIGGRQACMNKRDIQDVVGDTLDRMLPPFDSALMLNPATEGLRAVQIIHALNKWQVNLPEILGTSSRRYPILHVFSSDADAATKSQFPTGSSWGRTFAFAAPPRKDESQYGRIVGGLSGVTQEQLLDRPLPFVESAVTHRIVVDDGATFCGVDVVDGERVDAVEKGSCFKKGFHRALHDASNQQLEWTLRVPPLVHAGEEGATPAEQSDSIGGDGDAPIWVLRSDGDFVRSHNDVFGQAIGELVGKLLVRNSAMSLRCSNSPSFNSVCSIASRLESSDGCNDED